MSRDDDGFDDYLAHQDWLADVGEQEWDEACRRAGYCRECHHMGMHHEACPNAEQDNDD